MRVSMAVPFAVVADEVRQLSKTHQAVSQSTELLSALNSVTDRVKQHIEAVAHSTEYQCDLAKSLQGISRQVGEHSLQASQTAQQSQVSPSNNIKVLRVLADKCRPWSRALMLAAKKLSSCVPIISEKIQFLLHQFRRVT